jgi:hypothetical protein
MASMVSILESLTPSVNAPLAAHLIFLYLIVHGQPSGGGFFKIKFYNNFNLIFCFKIKILIL